MRDDLQRVDWRIEWDREASPKDFIDNRDREHRVTKQKRTGR